MQNNYSGILLLLFLLAACRKDNANGALAPQPDPPVSPPTSDNTINKMTGFWYYLDSRDLTDEQIALEASRRSVVVMQAWKNGYIAKFKAANPDIKVLVYKNLSASINSYEIDAKTGDTLYSTGVSFSYADKNHPDWFLLDDDNKRIPFADYDFLMQMDIGNTGYQQYWADNVAAGLVKYGWDGVFLDDVLFAPAEHHPGLLPKQYKTAADFQKAYKSMLEAVQGKLKETRKISIANMSGAYNFPGEWDQYLQFVDGALDEWWLINGPGDYSGGPLWQLKLAEAATATAKNKTVLVMPHSSETDAQGYYYALASFWLVNDGAVSFAEQPVRDDYYLPYEWRAEYDWNMGKPLGAYDSLGTNFKYYRRDFTRAVVLVNPQAANISINLEQTYLNEAGQRITYVVLPARSGTILRRIFQ